LTVPFCGVASALGSAQALSELAVSLGHDHAGAGWRGRRHGAPSRADCYAHVTWQRATNANGAGANCETDRCPCMAGQARPHQRPSVILASTLPASPVHGTHNFTQPMQFLAGSSSPRPPPFANGWTRSAHRRISTGRICVTCTSRNCAWTDRQNSGKTEQHTEQRKRKMSSEAMASQPRHPTQTRRRRRTSSWMSRSRCPFSPLCCPEMRAANTPACPSGRLPLWR
jgi:hypothetical protein